MNLLSILYVSGTVLGAGDRMMYQMVLWLYPDTLGLVVHPIPLLIIRICIILPIDFLQQPECGMATGECVYQARST